MKQHIGGGDYVVACCDHTHAFADSALQLLGITESPAVPGLGTAWSDHYAGQVLQALKDFQPADGLIVLVHGDCDNCDVPEYLPAPYATPSQMKVARRLADTIGPLHKVQIFTLVDNGCGCPTVTRHNGDSSKGQIVFGPFAGQRQDFAARPLQ